jgi:hypothetical protein
MQRWSILGAAALLLAACTRTPVIDPMPPADALAAAALCRTPFVKGPLELVHAVRADLPGRGTARLIGVSVVDPGPRTIQAALLTIEGIVLFAASWDGGLKVTRALPPFDKALFADGLLADIRLLFFPLPEPPTSVGRTADGLPVCRYTETDGTIVDVTVAAGRGWEISRYDPEGRPTRTVKARNPATVGPEGNSVAGQMELSAPGRSGYRLTLDLIAAQPVETARRGKGWELKDNRAVGTY